MIQERSKIPMRLRLLTWQMIVLVVALTWLVAWWVFDGRLKPDPQPDAGPPAAQHDAIEGVWQEDFQDEAYDYRESGRLWLIDLNRLTNEGCRVVGVTAAIGGAVALMECGGSDDAE